MTDFNTGPSRGFIGFGTPKPFVPPAPPKPEEPPPVPVPPKKSTAKHVRKTLTGRVVYNRPRHFVNLKAVNRFLTAYLTTDDGKPENTLDFIQDFLSVMRTLAGVALKYLAPGDYANVIVQVLNIFNRR